MSILKKNIRVIAFDDGHFLPRKSKKCLLVGVIVRLPSLIEGILTEKIVVDGFDSTNKIIKLTKEERFYKQIKLIMLNGINFAGFNIADIEKIYKETKKPVAVIFTKKPNLQKYIEAIKTTKNFKKRLNIFNKAPLPEKILDNVYAQFLGIDKKTLATIVKRCQIISKIPEPLRLSHLIASSLSYGKSTKQ